jgi:prepilin-type N-terminal cleavage/methylation domain-containing protein
MKRTSKAFTLIEVLLGLTIFAIIGVTLYNMFWMGMKIDDKANSINKSYQEARTAFDVMARDLENTFAYDFSSSYPQEISFKGKPDEMTFLVPTEQGIRSVRFYLGLPDWGRITKVIIAQHVKKSKGVSTDSTPIRFLMRQEINFPEYMSKKKNLPEGEMVTAVIKAEGLKFSYAALKKVPDGQRPRVQDLIWQDHWDEVALPQAVQVEFVLFDAQNPKAEPRLRREIYLNSLEFNND